ncbi:hypothetical protein RHGRI_020347 [Rhododendron griersonianum]|uniref:LYR motif containing domain-containing protein n=1 Tax=Rhododendron griersonianum TaxID=479676 RepID=A0AAV6JI10_9ERIC|nr:hypothetical protein RHGRI_020347 [Rhododendron griersonianum]
MRDSSTSVLKLGVPCRVLAPSHEIGREGTAVWLVRNDSYEKFEAVLTLVGNVPFIPGGSFFSPSYTVDLSSPYFLHHHKVVSHVESFMDKFPDGDPAQHLIEELLLPAAKKAEARKPSKTLKQQTRFNLAAPTNCYGATPQGAVDCSLGSHSLCHQTCLASPVAKGFAVTRRDILFRRVQFSHRWLRCCQRCRRPLTYFTKMAKGLIWATAEDLARNRGQVLSLYRQLLRSLNSPDLPLNLAARLSEKAEVRAIFMVASEERSLHNIQDLFDAADYSLSLLRKGEIPKYIQ